MNKDSKIYIAGHRGLVGSAIHRKLVADGYNNIVFVTSELLDLRDQKDVKRFFTIEKPEYVFLVAAKAGGVLALDTYRAEAIYNNLMIQTNVIHSAYENGVKKLLFLGSNCLYPTFCGRPIKEEYFMSGQLEKTTEAYAIAKIAGIHMCQAYRAQYGCNFISALPVNIYGEKDKDDLQTAHVMAALIRKFREAIEKKEPFVSIWGTGTARREFMQADDLADACLFLMLNYNYSEHINVGIGEDISIKDLALMIKEISGYIGGLIFDPAKPDGSLNKVLDVSKLHALGWKHKIGLREGIANLFK